MTSDSGGSGSDLRRTPLYDRHRALGARMTAFSGWDMPVEYEGIIDEHHRVRQSVGIFDISHMGEIMVEGEGAPDFCDWVVAHTCRELEPGRARYTPICNRSGGIVDDTLIYRLTDGERGPRYLLVPNAANIDKDREWLLARRQEFLDEGGAPVAVDDQSLDTALIAVQGPAAADLMDEAASTSVTELKRFRAREDVGALDVPVLAARTGYTGEDGFELYCGRDDAVELWTGLLRLARERGGSPVGLGARNTLRLEAGLPLYGHEINDDISPLQAGLAYFVDFERPFVGRAALKDERDQGPPARLIGFGMVDRGVPRQGYSLWPSPEPAPGEKPLGSVTSGSYCPTLDRSMGLAYSRQELEAGDRLWVEVRGRYREAEVVEMPFYRR